MKKEQKKDTTDMENIKQEFIIKLGKLNIQKPESSVKSLNLLLKEIKKKDFDSISMEIGEMKDRSLLKKFRLYLMLTDFSY